MSAASQLAALGIMPVSGGSPDLLDDIEGWCVDGAGTEFPNARFVRQLVSEVERLRSERDSLLGAAASVIEPGSGAAMHAEQFRMIRGAIAAATGMDPDSYASMAARKRWEAESASEATNP